MRVVQILTPTRVVVASFLITLSALSLVLPLRASAPVRTFSPTFVPDTRQHRIDVQLARLMTRLHCTPPSLWRGTHRPGVLPASMILKADGTFTLRVAPWTYPAPRGQWVMALCSS